MPTQQRYFSRAGSRLAEQAGVRIYTIGVGADEMLVQTFLVQDGSTHHVIWMRSCYRRLLLSLVDSTGARSTEELAMIYQTLDELEPVERDVDVFRPLKPLYPWLLAIVFILSAS